MHSHQTGAHILSILECSDFELLPFHPIRFSRPPPLLLCSYHGFRSVSLLVPLPRSSLTYCKAVLLEYQGSPLAIRLCQIPAAPFVFGDLIVSQNSQNSSSSIDTNFGGIVDVPRTH